MAKEIIKGPTDAPKIEKLEVFVMSDSDFDNLIKQVYGHDDYCFVAEEEMGNDIAKLYRDISGKLDEGEQEDIEEFKETGKCSYFSRILLEDLCKNRHIEPGNYLIRVSW